MFISPQPPILFLFDFLPLKDFLPASLLAILFTLYVKYAVVVYSLRHVLLLQPHGLQPAKLLCPQDSPGKNTGVDCHFLLQGYSNLAGQITTTEHMTMLLWNNPSSRLSDVSKQAKQQKMVPRLSVSGKQVKVPLGVVTQQLKGARTGIQFLVGLKDGKILEIWSNRKVVGQEDFLREAADIVHRMETKWDVIPKARQNLHFKTYVVKGSLQLTHVSY